MVNFKTFLLVLFFTWHITDAHCQTNLNKPNSTDIHNIKYDLSKPLNSLRTLCQVLITQDTTEIRRVASKDGYNILLTERNLNQLKQNAYLWLDAIDNNRFNISQEYSSGTHTYVFINILSKQAGFSGGVWDCMNFAKKKENRNGIFIYLHAKSRRKLSNTMLSKSYLRT